MVGRVKASVIRGIVRECLMPLGHKCSNGSDKGSLSYFLAGSCAGIWYWLWSSLLAPSIAALLKWTKHLCTLPSLQTYECVYMFWFSLIYFSSYPWAHSTCITSTRALPATQCKTLEVLIVYLSVRCTLAIV